MRTKIRKLFEMVNELKDQEVTLMAWVRTNRAQQKFGFLNINDGSYFDNVQVVYDSELANFEEISKIRVGASVKVNG